MEAKNENVVNEDTKCPHCGYRIGKPIDKTGGVFVPEDKPSFCFCVRCLGVCFVSTKEVKKATNKELFQITLLRPQEVLRMMDATLRLNANLPLIDAEKN